MLATFEPISEDRPWSARAAAGDALQRVEHDAPFLAVWIEDGQLRWSKANTNFVSLSMMAVFLQELARSCLK